MLKVRKLKSPGILGLVVALALSVMLVSPASAVPSSQVVYDATPNPLPPNVPSVGFEATSTAQFGDRVVLGGTDRTLWAVTVTMSDWALYAAYSSDPRYSGNSVSWTHPITVNIYGTTLTGGVPDTLLATKTQNVTIPWRPVADPTCPDTGYGSGFAWRAGDGQCYNGLAFNATFDMSSPNVVLPNEVIVGIAYNTADYGSAPIHQAGPYNSLNVGVPTNQVVAVGSDANPDAVFWNTSYGPFYADGGAAGVGIFRQDTNWSPNGTVAIRIMAGSASLVVKNWRVYNVRPGTASFWDINKAQDTGSGGVMFPIQQFVSPTTGSFAVYLLANYNVDITGKTITADVSWTHDAFPFATRSATCSSGAYVRLEFQDVTAGPYDPNDYWWSVTSLDLNLDTTGNLIASLTEAGRSTWTNMVGLPATDKTTTTWLNWNTGQIEPMATPYDGFTHAMKNVKQIGLSFGNACSYASGVALDGGTGTFTMSSFTVTP